VAVVLPGAWSAPVVAANASGVDAASAPAPSLDTSLWQLEDTLLNQLLQQARRANTSIQLAQGALREARAPRDVDAAGLWPVVDASAVAQRSRSGREAAIRRYSVSVNGAWTVDVFGAQRHAVASSEATARAAAESLAAEQADIATELTLAYCSLRSAQARRLIALDNLASYQDTWQITRWRVQAGLLTSLEDQQALAAREQAAALLPALGKR